MVPIGSGDGLRGASPAGMYTRLLRPALGLLASPAACQSSSGGDGSTLRPCVAPRHRREPHPAMARLVMKFGGTSVADIERIRNVARHVKREVDAGHEVAVVASAMAGTTNRLVEWCREASVLHDAREYDTDRKSVV